MRDAALAMRLDARVVRAAHPVVVPLLAFARASVLRLPGIGVLVQDTELAREVLSDSERFTKNGPGASSELWTPVLGERVLLNMHGDDHRRMRRTLQPIFAPAFVRPLVDAMIRPRWEAAVRSLEAGERVDLAKLTRETASDAIASLVGLDRGAVTEQMFVDVTRITGMVKLSKPRLRRSQIAEAQRLLHGLTQHAHAAYAGDESTVPGRMRALGLSEREALGAVGAFILTGTETLAGAIPRIAAMLIDADYLREMTDGNTESAIGESLRWTTPSLATLRSSLTDTSIGAVRVQRGERIVIATYKANRQSGAWNPEAGTSRGLKQLWFGAGEHFCIGAPLAMTQIRTAVDALRAAGPLRIASRAPVRRTLIPAYRSLIVERQ
ncbi:cytochrome P450 [uncultured Agrococcus sp.]|uniref:cytochrome P450 n=1 Tax=uncultured Agrococcus sp. TaxID=382258 RepID=UPI0025F91E69|nr:cytochrome P450 [uncultured Agrococcus sp.]